METRASKRKKLPLQEANQPTEPIGKDQFSDLPDAISHHILSFLPIQSIAQSSLLSRRWRYLWSSFPSLDFSEIGLRIEASRTERQKTISSLKELRKLESKAMEFVPQVLSRRHKHSEIRTFRLTGHLTSPCLRKCICSLVKHKVIELELDVCLSYRFDIPRSLYSCDSLRMLTLKSRSPGLEPRNKNHSFRFVTSSFMSVSGLRSLHTLSLTFIRFMVDSPLVEDLFSASSFPLLKKLSLSECEGMPSLRIYCLNIEDISVECTEINGLDIFGKKLERLKVRYSLNTCGEESTWVNIFAPNLKTFDWIGNGITDKCSVQNFPCLEEVNIVLLQYPKSAAKVQRAVTLLSALSNTKSFFTALNNIEILSEIHFAGGLSCWFDNLKILLIGTSLKKRDIPGIACLLRRAPNLKCFTLVVIRNTSRTETDNDMDLVGEAEYWESLVEGSKSFLLQLEMVTISVQNMVPDNAVNLMKFLLKHGSALRKMTLNSQGDSGENLPLWQETIDQIKGFDRASPDVNILLE